MLCDVINTHQLSRVMSPSCHAVSSSRVVDSKLLCCDERHFRFIFNFILFGAWYKVVFTISLYIWISVSTFAIKISQTTSDSTISDFFRTFKGEHLRHTWFLRYFRSVYAAHATQVLQKKKKFPYLQNFS